MATFPTSIACISTAGYKEELDVKPYLGGNSFVDQPIVTVTVGTKSHSDMQSFMSWYINSIAYGRTNFTVSLPMFGVTRLWDARFVTKIDASLKATTVREINMKLEILDDISQYI